MDVWSQEVDIIRNERREDNERERNVQEMFKWYRHVHLHVMRRGGICG